MPTYRAILPRATEATKIGTGRPAGRLAGAGIGLPTRGPRHREGGQRHTGFTLVELLVVIAVIAMLTALLLPVLAQAREGVRRTACLSNLRQLANAHHLYVQDWDERLPAWEFPRPRGQRAPDDAQFWPGYLGPYLRSPQVTRDPAAGEPPIRSPGSAPPADYVLLTWQRIGDNDLPSDPYVRWPGPPLMRDQVVRPSETIQWMDGWTTPLRTTGEPGRHMHGVNVAFVDGHARWMRSSEFWKAEWDRRGFYWLYHGCADR